MRSTGRYYLLNVVQGGIFILAASLMVGLLNTSTPAWPLSLVFFALGLSYGGMLTVTLLALVSACDHKHQAVITSASYAFRSTGSTIGISIAGAVFQNILSTKLWDQFGGRKNAAEIIGRIRNSLDAIKFVPPDWQRGTLDAYVGALQGVWVTTLVMAILGVCVSLFLREHVLHKNLERRPSQ